MTLSNLQTCFFCADISLCSLSDLHGVLRGLLHPDPPQRMTLDQLLLQFWVSQPISLVEYSWTEVVAATQSYCKYSNTRASFFTSDTIGLNLYLNITFFGHF